jgi:hypothetical protein
LQRCAAGKLLARQSAGAVIIIIIIIIIMIMIHESLPFQQSLYDQSGSMNAQPIN